MKKIFTLIAVAAMALTVNAQGKYAMEEGEEVAYGTQPAKDKRVENCTMYFGNPDFSGGTAFSAAAADGSVEGYTAYTAGNGVNGNKDGGTIYVFKPTIDGNITVAVVYTASELSIAISVTIKPNCRLKQRLADLQKRTSYLLAGFHVPHDTLDTHHFASVSSTGISPSSSNLSRLFNYLHLDCVSPNPSICRHTSVWALPISLATTLRIVVLLSFPPGT